MALFLNICQLDVKKKILLWCFKQFFFIRENDITYNKANFDAIAIYHLKYFFKKLKAFRIKFSIMNKLVMFEIKKPSVE